MSRLWLAGMVLAYVATASAGPSKTAGGQASATERCDPAALAALNDDTTKIRAAARVDAGRFTPPRRSPIFPPSAACRRASRPRPIR